MLNLFIAFLSLIIWSSVVIYYFRAPLFSWLDNRFGKDPVLPDAEEDEPAHEPENHAPHAPDTHTPD